MEIVSKNKTLIQQKYAGHDNETKQCDHIKQKEGSV